MPTYDYRCTHCDVAFELQTTIDERDAPCAVPCPGCAAALERYLPSPPGFGDPMRLGRIKAPDAFNDVLKHMKAKHRHSTINPRN